ncbi:MAG: hypothetical protein K0S54_2482 [Alphaproteobacteria bacterium]|jgi:hypothetical protein|nr:hypothetical protein [Alphaproteobacteria bacterium]
MQNQLRHAVTERLTVNWFENAVLVYGPRKAGTTLLHNLLDGSADLFVYPEELKLKRLVHLDVESGNGAELYRQRSRMFHTPLPRFDLTRYAAAWNEVIRQRGKHTLKDLIRYDVDFVIDAITGAKPPAARAWCAKEVGGNTGAVIGWWLRNFSAPRVVFIVRNPLMVTRAVLNDRRRKQRRLSLREIWRETMDPIKVLLAQKSLLGDPHVVAIAYEDLVANPQGTMRKVANFLAIPNGSYLTLPTIFGEPVVVRTASNATSGVFDSGASWSDGLTLRERIVVVTASVLARIIPGRSLDYQALAAATRQSPR